MQLNNWINLQDPDYDTAVYQVFLPLREQASSIVMVLLLCIVLQAIGVLALVTIKVITDSYNHAVIAKLEARKQMIELLKDMQ